MAKRPRSARISATSDTIHLVARTHDDSNEILTLCGRREQGIWTGGARLCETCQQTYEDLAAEVQQLAGRLGQPVYSSE
jgi:hypothetical protein